MTGIVLALGPIGVLPSAQRRGIGAAVMREALEVARSIGVPAVVLPGHPEYCPRFGFQPARPLGLEAPAPWPEDAWMACPLVPRDRLPRGVVRFPRAFEPL